jgi:hypothetical protein
MRDAHWRTWTSHRGGDLEEGFCRHFQKCLKWYRGNVKSRVAFAAPHYIGKLDPDPIRVRSWIRILIRVKIEDLKRLKMDPLRSFDFQNEGVETLT